MDNLRKNKLSVVVILLLSFFVTAVHAAKSESSDSSKNPKNILAIEWLPKQYNIAVGEQISFTEVIPAGNSKPEDFLYSLLVYSTEQGAWKTEIAYQDWPLPKIYFNRPGGYSVQIAVIKKDTPVKNQSRQLVWITKYSVKNAQHSKSSEMKQS